MNYNVPLTYITNVLFSETAQGLVQGMVTKWQTNAHQQVSLIATLGTSKPGLLCAVMGISLMCALIATLAGTLPRSARRVAALDVSRLLAISRNPQLDTVLQPYSDWNVKMEEEVLSARIGYGWVEGLNWRALVIAPTRHGGVNGVECQSDDETRNYITRDPVLPQTYGEVIDFDGSRKYSSPFDNDAKRK